MRTITDNDGGERDEYYRGGGEIVTGEGGSGRCDLLVLARDRHRPRREGVRSFVRVGGSGR